MERAWAFRPVYVGPVAPGQNMHNMQSVHNMHNMQHAMHASMIEGQGRPFVLPIAEGTRDGFSFGLGLSLEVVVVELVVHFLP
jgi:hypothetical protein